MKSKIRKLKLMLLVFVCLSIFSVKGCRDAQSEKVIYVSAFKVVLVYDPDYPEYAHLLDAWKVSGDPQGEYICGAGFGFPKGKRNGENKLNLNEGTILCLLDRN